MPWYLVVLLVLAALVAIALIAGSLIAREHHATSTIELPVAPAQVWSAISEWRAFPQWRKGETAIEAFTASDGREGWVETSRFGRMPLVVERAEPHRLFVGRIADDRLPFGGTWTHRLEPLPGGGTRLASTEDGFIRPPLFRLLAKCVFGYHQTLNAWQRQLAGRFGATAQPRNT
jgi:hypothetical protein